MLNIDLDDDRWTQASLPVRWRGLGIRSVLFRWHLLLPLAHGQVAEQQQPDTSGGHQGARPARSRRTAIACGKALVCRPRLHATPSKLERYIYNGLNDGQHVLALVTVKQNQTSTYQKTANQRSLVLIEPTVMHAAFWQHPCAMTYEHGA